MKTIQFKDLNNIRFDLHKVDIIYHNWNNGDEYPIPQNGRPDNGIMFLSDCEFEYVRPDGTVYDRAENNSLVYSPKGSVYTCRFIVPRQIKKENTTDFLINFLLLDENGEEFKLSDDRIIISPENPRYYWESFSRIDSLGRKGFSPSPRIKSMLYSLLSDISFELQKNDILSRRYASVYPAIKHIRTTDISELDASALAGYCHLSESCFRRLFREYTGMPPLEYVNHLKISQARAKLRSGVLSVAQVAESLGFSDASYFSRFYKKATGHSPSEDMK